MKSLWNYRNGTELILRKSAIKIVNHFDFEFKFILIAEVCVNFVFTFHTFYQFKAVIQFVS